MTSNFFLSSLPRLLSHGCFWVPSLLFTVCTLFSYSFFTLWIKLFLDLSWGNFILTLWLHFTFTIHHSTMAKKNGEKLSSKPFFLSVCVPRYTKRKKSFHVCLIQYGIRSIMWVDWNWFSRKKTKQENPLWNFT